MTDLNFVLHVYQKREEDPRITVSGLCNVGDVKQDRQAETVLVQNSHITFEDIILGARPES
jgi:hypothetical protein